MKKIAISLLILFAIIIGGCTLKGKVTQQLVDNDEDVHGCIGSAEYSGDTFFSSISYLLYIANG